MFKKMLKGLMIGGALMALVAPAHADIEINMFGASAQYNYWSTFTPSWMNEAAPDGAIQCATGDIYHAAGSMEDRDNYIAICLDDMTIETTTGTVIGTGGGSAQYTGDDIIVRYTTFNSAKGFQAALGVCEGVTECGANCSERRMADINNTVFTKVTMDANNCTTQATTGVNGLACTEVNIGCGDTGPECFTQSSTGPLYWDVYTCNDAWCKMGSTADWPLGEKLVLDKRAQLSRVCKPDPEKSVCGPLCLLPQQCRGSRPPTGCLHPGH